MFKAELFNATEWATLFAMAGAKYIVPTSKVNAHQMSGNL